MTDDEIIQSAEAVRLAEIRLASEREQRAHERWKLLQEKQAAQRERRHRTLLYLLDHEMTRSPSYLQLEHGVPARDRDPRSTSPLEKQT